MTREWANHEPVGPSELFETLHRGLTVELIATPRSLLMTCFPDEPLGQVMERNEAPYDFLPVVQRDSDGEGSILGLLHAAPYFGVPSPAGQVRENFDPLSEKSLIGADASILEFIKTADKTPCRLVVAGGQIDGLVSLSDLQKLPVRAALFALITGFEIVMAEAIRFRFPESDDWKGLLSHGRLKKVEQEIFEAHQSDAYVDDLLFTQFVDKATIVRKVYSLPWSTRLFEECIAEFRDLRDDLAHANSYASTTQQAKKVCGTVRNLLDMKAQFVALYAGGVSAEARANVGGVPA